MTSPSNRPASACLNTKLLPPQLRLLIRAIGEGAALELVRHCGGARFTVPTHASDDHWLCPIIGKEALQALIDEYKGITMDLPKYDSFIRQQRHLRVRSLAREGLSQSDVAVRTGYSRRHVISIVHAEEDFADVDHRQMDLFRGWLEEQSQAAQQNDNAAPQLEAKPEPETTAQATPTAHNPFGLAKR